MLAALAMNGLPWLGWQVYEKQAACWPRWPFPEAMNPRYARKYRYYSGFAYTFPEDDYTAATAEFPVNVKKAQAYLAYDVIYRGIQGRTSPSAGPAQDAIKSLSLFGDISLSFGEHQERLLMNDSLSLLGLLRAGHPEIYLLLAKHVTEINFISDWSDYEPELLDEVVEA